MKLRSYRDNESPLEDLAAIKNKIVDLGITDNGILTDLNQAIGIASEYKSIYEIFDNKSKKLFDDIKEHYRSKSKRSGLGTVTMNGITFDLGGGLDSDSLVDKYNDEQDILQNFEDWIKENYYQTKDGKQIGGPSEANIKEWLTDERKRVEKEVFGFKTENEQMIDEIKNRPANQRRGVGFGREDDDFNQNYNETESQEETPGQGNTRFEVGQTFENSRGRAGFGGGMTRATETYTVKLGDTLETISNKLNVNLDDLININKIKDPNFISEGQELVVPSVKRVNMKEQKNKQIDALNLILKDTDLTNKIPQPKIREMLLAVGFKPEIARIMAAVSMAESAGDPMIDTVKSGSDPKKENEFSIGLLQLNMKDDKERLLGLFDIKSEEELYNPIINVIAAKRLYDEQGLEAWGAYTDNSYKQFLTD